MCSGTMDTLGIDFQAAFPHVSVITGQSVARGVGSTE